MLDRWGQVICTSLKWSNHPHLEIVLDKRSYKWKPRNGWEAASKPLKALLLQICLQQVPGVPSHMSIPNCQMAKVWPQFLTENSSYMFSFSFFFFFYCQLYICSPGPESFFLSSSLPEIEITRKKLSEGWVNFENQLWKSVSWRWNLFSSARNRILQILDGPKLMVHMPSKKQREWSTKRVVAESKKDEKMLFLDPKGTWHSV